MPDQLELRVMLESADDGLVDREVRSLRDEVLRLREVESVVPVPGEQVPANAKAADLSIVGALSISLVSGAVPALLGVISQWHHRRDERCTIRLTGPGGAEIEIDDIEPDRVAQVISRWSEALATDE